MWKPNNPSEKFQMHKSVHAICHSQLKQTVLKFICKKITNIHCIVLTTNEKKNELT